MENLLKKIKTAPEGSVKIGPYLFELVMVDNDEKISVVYPSEYGMERIIFPKLNYCEDWIRSTDIIWVCDQCGKIIDKKGIIERYHLGEPITYEYCEDCFKEYMDGLYGEGNWVSSYSDGKETYYHDLVNEFDCDEFEMTYLANYDIPTWFMELE